MPGVTERRGLTNELLIAVWDLSINVLGMKRQTDRLTDGLIYSG